MPISAPKNQEEFDKLVQNNEVVVVLFCSKSNIPVDVLKSFGRLSLKVPEYKFGYVDLRERPDISSRVRITGSYVISVYRSGGLTKAFTLADMEFYTCLATMDKATLDQFVSVEIQNHSATAHNVNASPESSYTNRASSRLSQESTHSSEVHMPSPPPPPAANNSAAPVAPSAASGSASVTVGPPREPNPYPPGGYSSAQQHLPAHMPTPYGNPAIIQPPHPMYIYPNYQYPHPPPPSPNNAAGYGTGFASTININSATSSAADSGRLVGNHLSELIAIKVAEKISSQG
ncbi:hypothetical protein LPJ81_003007, partial [Coemansia sp. IMI 209127]